MATVLTESAPAEREVTLVVVRRPRPGCEVALEAWLAEIIDASSRFPGHLGATVLRPRPGQQEYVLLYRYASEQALADWQASPACRELVARADAQVEEPATLVRQTGLEAWFTLPGRPLSAPPPRWKMALLTWGALCLIIPLWGWAASPLVGGWHPAPRLMFTTALVTSTMTWLAMPRVTRLAWRWLYPVTAQEGERRTGSR